MMNDIMVDLETMDNVASAAIVSIGAIQCDLTTGETGKEYYRIIDLDNQIGTTVNPQTLYWWMGQSEGARQALLVPGKITQDEMCISFTKWCSSFTSNPGPTKISIEKIRLWGNGASFDNAILRYSFRQCRRDFPIQFWNDRDMRTILGFYPRQLQEKWRKSNLRVGTAHNALDDARHQVKYCSDILKELGVGELY